MDVKKFIIEEFGLPEDVGFNKCPKITYFDLYELLTKFEKECSMPVISELLQLEGDCQECAFVKMSQNCVGCPTYENLV